MLQILLGSQRFVSELAENLFFFVCFLFLFNLEIETRCLRWVRDTKDPSRYMFSSKYFERFSLNSKILEEILWHCWASSVIIISSMLIEMLKLLDDGNERVPSETAFDLTRDGHFVLWNGRLNLVNISSYHFSLGLRFSPITFILSLSM